MHFRSFLNNFSKDFSFRNLRIKFVSKIFFILMNIVYYFLPQVGLLDGEGMQNNFSLFAINVSK